MKLFKNVIEFNKEDIDIENPIEILESIQLHYEALEELSCLENVSERFTTSINRIMRLISIENINSPDMEALLDKEDMVISSEEGVKDIINKVWDSIKKFFKWVKDKLINAWNNVVGSIGFKQAKIETELSKAAESLKKKYSQYVCDEKIFNEIYNKCNDVHKKFKAEYSTFKSLSKTTFTIEFLKGKPWEQVEKEYIDPFKKTCDQLTIILTSLDLEDLFQKVIKPKDWVDRDKIDKYTDIITDLFHIPRFEFNAEHLKDSIAIIKQSIINSEKSLKSAQKIDGMVIDTLQSIYVSNKLKEQVYTLKLKIAEKITNKYFGYASLYSTAMHKIEEETKKIRDKEYNKIFKKG